MSTSAREEINFWPGYVDALINVLLNLLFLVGIFTVCLLVLNAQVAIVQKEAARQKLNQLLADSSVQERKQMTQDMLKALPSAPPQQSQPEIHEAPPPAAPQVQSVPQEAAISSPVVKVLPAPMLEPSQVAPDQGQTREIRIRRRTPVNEPSKESVAEIQPAAKTQSSPDQWVDGLTGGRVVGQLVFAPQEFALSSQVSLPSELRADSAAQWQLVVVSEPDNPRLAREAFARLVAVRNQMLQSGFSGRQIQIKVRPRPVSADWSGEVERTVFIVAMPQ